MSGIAAVWHLDGAPLEPSLVGRLSARMATCPHDTSGVWTSGPVGLAQVDLRTTPEAVHDRWPLVSADGGLVLAANLRLDNRAELIEALGLQAHARQGLGDGGILLAAWERWGESCPAHLAGDFAFVLWDAKRRLLCCARDHVGTRPLYYHLGPRLFAAASDTRTLLAIPGVPRELDELRISAFLVPGLDNRTGTSYRHVARLPAAHTLAITADGGTPRAYWRLDPMRELPPASDEEYAGEYRRLLTDAVRSRLRSTTVVSAALSGGLDSSSIVCVARTLEPAAHPWPLRTYTARFPSAPRADEGAYVDAVVQQGGVVSTMLDGERLDPLADFEASSDPDPELHGLGYYMHEALFRAARADGSRVFLEGMFGDTATSRGWGHLFGLALAGRWVRLAREVHAIANWTGESRSLLLRRVLSATAPPMVVKVRLLRLTRGPAALHPIREELARRTHLEARLIAASRTRDDRGLDPARAEQWRIIESGLVADVEDVLAFMATAAGVDARDPFCDRRLLEYCLALPTSQRLRGGRTRIVAHNAMAPLFPPLLRQRRGKASIDLMLSSALRVYGSGRLDRLMDDAAKRLEPYVPPAAVRYAYAAYRAQPTLPHQKRVFRLASLALWLRHVAP